MSSKTLRSRLLRRYAPRNDGAAWCHCQQSKQVSMTDWILRGGEVVDGSGRPRRRADVAIAGDRIAAVGVVGKVAGACEIDVTGKIVAPGFIDVHTHDDRALLATPDMAAKASQGV